MSRSQSEYFSTTAINAENLINLYQFVLENESKEVLSHFENNIKKDLEFYFNMYHFIIEITGNGEYGATFSFNSDWPIAHTKEEHFLKTIAPFVDIGTYIEMIDTDSYHHWRWVFDGKNVIENFPKRVWDDPMSLVTPIVLDDKVTTVNISFESEDTFNYTIDGIPKSSASADCITGDWKSLYQGNNKQEALRLYEKLTRSEQYWQVLLHCPNPDDNQHYKGWVGASL